MSQSVSRRLRQPITGYYNTISAVYSDNNGQLDLGDGGPHDFLYIGCRGEDVNPTLASSVDWAGNGPCQDTLESQVRAQSYPPIALGHSTYVDPSFYASGGDTVGDSGNGWPATPDSDQCQWGALLDSGDRPSIAWPGPATVTGPAPLSWMSSPPPSPEAKPYHCDYCPSSFKHRKDLNRHKSTLHPTGNEPLYCCRCGKRDFRKDNYMRHVERCNKQHILPEYSCKCDERCENKEPHMLHVQHCVYGFGRSGRPKGL